MNKTKIESFPAHMPYEDGWLFCEICQRFYKTNNHACPIHPISLHVTSTHTKYTKSGLKKIRKVWNNGLGLPVWAAMKEFINSPEGEESVKQFRAIQESIRTKIENAPENKEITYSELGATDFGQHWFIKRGLLNE
jgi:hypothetical protein